MTWRQKIQMEVSAWAWTKWLDERLRAGSVPSLLIHSANWWTLAIVGSRELQLLFLMTAVLTACNWQHLATPLWFDVGEKEMWRKFMTLVIFKRITIFFSLCCWFVALCLSVSSPNTKVCPLLCFIITFLYLLIVMLRMQTGNIKMMRKFLFTQKRDAVCTASKITLNLSGFFFQL